MEGIILELSKRGKLEEIQSLLNQQEEKKVAECVTNYILKGRQDPLPLIKQVLRGSQGVEEKSVKRCIVVITSIIRLLQKNEINSTTAFDIVSLLLTELDLVSPTCLARLAQFYVDLVKAGIFDGGKTALLLPKLLTLISLQDSIPQEEGCIKGSELKSHIINSLCSSRWTPAVTLQLAPVFPDVVLTLEELRFVVEKLVRLLPDVDLPDQPAIVFQLLRLSAKGQKRLVLESVASYYTGKNEAVRGSSLMVDSGDLMFDTVCVRTLREVEGTVIVHVTQAVEQHQELGTQFLKYLKQQSSSAVVLSPFNLSLLLSMTQLHQFQEQIFEFLKSAVLKSFRDEERQKQSLWVRECYPMGLKTEEMVLEAVEHSTFGWDNVVQGLVMLGFGLMDSFGPKLVFGAIPEATLSNDHLTPTQAACQLGRRILLKTFKAHEIVRSPILQQVFNYIITKSASPVTHYLDLLSEIVFSAPQLLLECRAMIQDMFLQLTNLHARSAQGLLSAVQPLLKLSPQLKDSLILVLRKAMFSRQLDSRKIGAMGFLMILKHFHVVGGLPSSQVSQPIALSQLQVDVHSGYNKASNEALCLEILGNLRRCFTQQADIRLSIYQGLWDVLHRNSQLMNPVMEMILSQLKKYYEPDEEVCPPVRMESCILVQGDQVFLAEPLAHLFGCAQLCLRKSLDIVSQMQRDEDEDEGSSGHPSLQLVESILTKLTTRIIDAEMEDFELDKSADFSCGNSVGVKNNIYAILLLGLYDVLMEFKFETGKGSTESFKEVLQLFSNYCKLSAVLREKSAAGSGKRNKSTSFKTPISLLSMQTVINLLQVVIEDESGAATSQLREDKQFLLHLLAVAVQKLAQISQKGSCDGETVSKEALLSRCWSLARLCYLYYIGKRVEGSPDHLSKKETILCLESVDLVVTIANSTGSSAVVECLRHLAKELPAKSEHVRDAEVTETSHTYIKTFQSLVSTFLSEDKGNQNWKECSTLLSLIASLSSRLPPDSSHFQQVYSWLLKVATDQNVEDAATCKQILSMLLHLAKQTRLLPQLTRNISQDIHSQFRDIDTEEGQQAEDKTNFSVTKSAHCPPNGVLTLVLTYIESDLDDLEWVIKHHKADMEISVAKSSEGTSSQVEAMDKSICTRLGMLATSFLELTHSRIKTKVSSQALLKSLTKLYNALTSLTKHYVSLYTNKTGQLGSRFEKLMTLVGRQLTQATYSFISYVQNSEKEQDEEQRDKKKKKTGSVFQAGAANAMQQMKTISNLIFAIEQLEKYLIQLSNKSKVNLMEHMKLSTSRDFRILADKVVMAVENGVSSDSEPDKENDEDEESRDGSTNDNTGSEEKSETEQKNPKQTEPPAKKKRKLSKIKKPK